VEEKEKYHTGTSLRQNFGFISPVRGIVSQSFDISKKHYGTDITIKKKSPVKSIADGMVIFSDWTPDNGNVIIIRHKGPWLSVYKHNRKLLKKQGEKVKAGEVIAISGNVGET
jgi:murein DD-endopeptidase MepM/ murein hydrolase activator NlpD